MDTNKNNQMQINWSRGEFPTWAKMLVAVAVVLLLMLAFFRVRTFEVSGNVRYSLEEVAEASGITEGDILMGVNKTSTASRLLVKLPYLERVVIHKELPGTIRFEVEECAAAAIAVSEFSTSWIINAEGKLLEETETLDEGQVSAYPVITGVLSILPSAGDIVTFDDTHRGALAMKVVNAVVDADMLGKIYQINVEDDQDIFVLYEQRIEVHLGDASEAEYQLQYLKSVLPKLDANASGVLDLSFSAGEQAIFHPIV